MRKYYLEIGLLLFLFCSVVYFVNIVIEHRRVTNMLHEKISQTRKTENYAAKEAKAKRREEEVDPDIAFLKNKLVENDLTIKQITRTGSNEITIQITKTAEAEKKLEKLKQDLSITYETDTYDTDGEEITVIWHKETKKKIRLDCICCNNQKSWQVWINGKEYDQDHERIADDVKIEKVTNECVTISDHNKTIKLKIEQNF